MVELSAYFSLLSINTEKHSLSDSQYSPPKSELLRAHPPLIPKKHLDAILSGASYLNSCENNVIESTLEENHD